MSKQITAIPVRHKDIRDREIYYVKLTNGTDMHVISVGKTTVQKLEDMLKENQPELPLNDQPNEMGNIQNMGGHRNGRNNQSKTDK